jgi:hypothetical protein
VPIFSYTPPRLSTVFQSDIDAPFGHQFIVHATDFTNANAVHDDRRFWRFHMLAKFRYALGFIQHLLNGLTATVGFAGIALKM